MGVLDKIVLLLEALLVVNGLICLAHGVPLLRYLIRFAIAVSLVRNRNR